MEVKQGYKQTEVGVIPEDWEVKELGSILSSKQLGGNYKNSETETEWPLIKMGNLGRGRINIDKLEYIDSTRPIDSRDMLKKDDVLFNTRNTLDLVGKVAIWRNELPKAYFNSNIMRFEFDKEYVSSSCYMNYILNTYISIKELREIATGTTSVAAIYTRDLVRLQLPLPPKPEQQTIAEALSDADALIESLEQLIQKKRLIKQGAMQELLTGKKRMPGFSGEWEVKKLGEIANIKTGSSNNQDKTDDGEYPFFVRSETVENINSYTHDCEAILVPGEGGIGSIFHYINGRFDVHQRVYAITKFVETVSGRFVFYFMVKNFGAHAMRNSVKATVDSLRLPTFQSFEMVIPATYQEQAIIASTLSDMGSEIDALEMKLEKACQLKHGMMHNLLTGKIRLI